MKRKWTHPQIWFCIHCDKSFVANGVSITKTIKCPHCNVVLNVSQLAYGGAKLAYSGINMLTRAVRVLDDFEDDFEAEDHAAIAKIDTLILIARQVIDSIKHSYDIGYLNDSYSDDVEESCVVEFDPKKKPLSKKLKGK